LGISVLVLPFLQPMIVLNEKLYLIDKRQCPATASDRLFSDASYLEHPFEIVVQHSLNTSGTASGNGRVVGSGSLAGIF
jgi:hypothetical protein